MQFQDFMRGFNWGNQPADKKDNDKDEEQPRQPKQPRAPAVQHAPEPQPNIFQEHAAMQADMYKSTQQAWANEHRSRVQQASDERDRQHEYEMEALRQQGESNRAMAGQRAPQYQPYQPTDQQQQARNRNLLNMAGLGGHTIHYDGRGNRTHTPHPYGFNPIARSLLG